MDFQGGGSDLAPCPNPEMPLHHFMYKKSLSQPCQPIQSAWWSANFIPWIDIQRFECSSPYCSAKVTIRFRPPRLSPAWVSLLTDPEAIKARAQKAISEDPDRLEGIAAPSPVDVLMTLRQYIVNALYTNEKRKIPGNNKKWVINFGESCRELLEYLGFSRRVNPILVRLYSRPKLIMILQEEDWFPPSPDSGADTPFENPQNVLLDDVEKEILVLRSQRPNTEQRGHSYAVLFAPTSAVSDLSKALGCTNCNNAISLTGYTAANL